MGSIQRAGLLRRLLMESPARTLRRIQRRLIGGGGRYRIPEDLGVVAFLEQLERRRCNYVVLRWFEELPHVDEGEDIDILVSDADIDKVVSLLVRSSDRNQVACDVRSVHGVPGASYRGAACYPPRLAEGILERATRHPCGARIPSSEDHFLSLAFHALYHKGYASGLPPSGREAPRHSGPEHPYADILAALSRSVGIPVAITMKDLHRELGARGWQPSIDMLVKWSRKNAFCAELVRLAGT